MPPDASIAKGEDMNTVLAERAARVQIAPYSNEDDDFRRRDWIAAQWQLCPYLIAFEGKGDCVIVDGCGRPIARVFADERVEILDPDDEFGSSHGLTFIHYDLGLPPEKPVRDYVRRYIETYKLAPELQRRRELLRRGELVGGRGY